MKVIDIKEYKKRINKLKELSKTTTPLLEKMTAIEKEKKLTLKNKHLIYYN